MRTELGYFREIIDEIRKDINGLKRKERSVINEMRKYCSHRKIRRVIVRKHMTPSVLDAPFYDDFVRYKVVCEDCGKVLQK